MNEEATLDTLAAIQRGEVAGERVRLNMGVWRDPYAPCGTTMCLAGFAAMLAGWRQSQPLRDEVARDGRTATFADAGREALGLSHDEACQLFWHTSGVRLFASVAELMGIDEQVLRDKVRERVDA